MWPTRLQQHFGNELYLRVMHRQEVTHRQEVAQTGSERTSCLGASLSTSTLNHHPGQDRTGATLQSPQSHQLPVPQGEFALKQRGSKSESEIDQLQAFIVFILLLSSIYSTRK